MAVKRKRLPPDVGVHDTTKPRARPVAVKVPGVTATATTSTYGLYCTVILHANGQSLHTTMPPPVVHNDPRVTQLAQQLLNKKSQGIPAQ